MLITVKCRYFGDVQLYVAEKKETEAESISLLRVYSVISEQMTL